MSVWKSLEIKVDAYSKKVYKMIQQDYKNNVKDSSGNVETTGFTIEVNESMFQMLTSNVYNNPILAVIREWSTNACDACIAADLDVNFDAHLPTISEPTFSVRDYGTGLPPEDIVGLFSNLGASTKRGSNSYNGTFGIGRMAGLAVSDAFTVESFYQGNHYTYAISMQKGVPVTMSLGSVPTTEPNGLKLSVNVDTDDIHTYVKTAEDLYVFFDHKPNINIPNMSLELDVSDNISDGWFFQKGERTNYLVMSQVPYAIPYNRQIEDHGFTSLVIKVPLGTVSFNPGRETLSLDKKTIEYVNSQFAKVKEEYMHAAILKMAEAKNDKEVYTCYCKLTSNAPYSIRSQITHEGFMSDTFKLLRDAHSHVDISSFTLHHNSVITLTYKSDYYKTFREVTGRGGVSPRTFFYSKHVIVDVKTNFKQLLLEEYRSTDVFTWQRRPGQDLDTAVGIAKESLKELGLDYVLASTIIEKYEGTEKTPKKQRLGVYTGSLSKYGVVCKESIPMTSEQLTKNTYLYLKASNTTPVISNSKFTILDYVNAYRLLTFAYPNEDLPKIKAVAKKYQHVVDELDNWIDMETYIIDRMKDTTFYTAFEEKPTSIRHTAISLTNVGQYPKEISDYFYEMRGYKEFTNDSKCIEDFTSLEIIKKFEAKTTNYTPEYDVDMEYLEKVYPNTMRLINYSGLSNYETANLPFTDILAITKLEEAYALHTADK